MSRNIRDLSFATFNLRNLQSVGGRTYGNRPPYPDTEDGRDDYTRHVDWIAARLVEIDAEVIGFQEVWSEAALADCFEAAGLAGAYDILARDAPGRGQPQVAAAVRRDRNGATQVTGHRWQPEFPSSFTFDQLRETDGAEEEITVTIDRFSRPVLILTLQPEGRSPTPPAVRVLVAHLKSKGPARVSFADPRPSVLNDHPDIARTALSHIRRVMEAGALRVMLDEMTGGDAPSPTVVLGDLNDGSQSITTELISGDPTYRLAADSRGGSRSDSGLYSVERLQQYRSMRHVYYTYVYRFKRESLDHVLVSEEFYDFSERRSWSFNSMEVINDHLNSKDYQERYGASDHGIVRAAFDWNPAE